MNSISKRGDVPKKARNTKAATRFCQYYKGMNSRAQTKELVTVAGRKGITCEVTPNAPQDPTPFGTVPRKCGKKGFESASAVQKGKGKERESQAREISASAADPMMGHPLPKHPALTGQEATGSANMELIVAIPTMAQKLERKGRTN
jgi:hypothetical protein